MVEMAQTPWCARIDADDVNLPHRLAEQVAFIEKHHNVGVVGTDIQFIDERGHDRPGAWTVETGDAEIRWRLRFCNALNHPTVMFRRAAVLAAGNYGDLKPGQDYDLWLRMAATTRMANLSQPLVRYRLHGRSVGANRGSGGSGSVNRQIATSRAALLFPGLTGFGAMRARDLGMFDHDGSVSLQDCLLFRRAAGRAALAIGQQAGYFRETRLYQSQYRRLVMRVLGRSKAAGEGSDRVCAIPVGRAA